VNARSVDEPIPTLTGSDRFGLVFLAKLRGTQDGHVKSAATGMDEPVGTLSAGGLHHALISGKAMGFLAPYYGQHGANSLDEAAPTFRTLASHALVAGTPPRIEDLYFRMLKAHEVKAGMAFAPDYVVLGNQREQVKQLGNAVTPPVMEMLIERCVESLM
jgi:DNA (cytosine-5)-methyltransferase 1